MPPRHLSRHSFHVAWTTATRCCMASVTGYFATCSRYRMLPCRMQMVTGARQYDHISPLLWQLHWLPVHQRVTFKVLGLVHWSLARVAPSYLADDCRLLSDVSRRTLQSSATNSRMLVIPLTHNKFRDRTFSAADPRQWNDLPPELRRPDLSFPIFRQKLKTLLFDDSA